MKLPEPQIAILVKQSELAATADELRRLRAVAEWARQLYQALMDEQDVASLIFDAPPEVREGRGDG